MAGYFPLDLFMGGIPMPPELAQLFGPQRVMHNHPGVQLMDAAEAGDTERVAQLLATLPVHPDQCTTDRGETALSRAAYKGHAPVVSQLLAAGANPRCPDQEGNEPLYYAGASGNVEVARLLLDSGAKAAAASRRGQNAVHMAAQEGQVAFLQFLVGRGAPADAPDAFGQTPLIYAATHGQLGTLRVLLQRGARVDARAAPPARSQTALDRAASKGDVAACRLLLQGGANPNGLHGSPLRWAAGGGSTEVAQLLLDAGADPTLADPTSQGGAIHQACIAGWLDIVQLLLGHPAVDPRALANQAAAQFGSLPLTLAAGKGHSAVVAALLEAGADCRRLDQHGCDALYYAAGKGDLASARLLLDAGAQLVVNPDGLSALCFAAESGHVDMLRLLLERFPDADLNLQTEVCSLTPLMFACRHGHVAAARFLVKRGANINLTDRDGITSLMRAATWEHPEVIKLLVELGADVNHAGRLPVGHTALLNCVETGLLDSAELLLERGADAAVVNAEGLSALIYACHLDQGSAPFVRLLLRHGAGAVVNAQDTTGGTALNYAAGHRNLEAAAALLEAGADPCLPNVCNQTALHFACEQGAVAVVKLLLEHGATEVINLPDHEGYTALYKAIGGQSEAILRVLLAHGADVSLANNMGQLPLHFASQLGLEGIVSLLLEAHRAQGVPVNPQEHKGHSPCHFAAEHGQLAVLEQLLEADPGLAAVRDSQGLLPVTMALQAGRWEEAECLLQLGDYFPASADSSSKTQRAAVVRQLLKALAQTALLSLHRAQRDAGIDLPPLVLPTLLSGLFA